MYRPIRAWARMLVRTWYRDRWIGAPPPFDAPLVLALNHNNGLVDAHFLLHAVPRRVRVLAKFRLFSIPVLGLLVRRIGAIPIYRKKDGVDTALNADSFAAIHAALARGEVIGVFPEGESRLAPHLRPLKTGAARMALGAEAMAGWTAGVLVVPVGISYRDRTRFRTEAEAWFGDPIRAAEFRDVAERDEYEASRQLTERIAEGLRARLAELPDLESFDDAAALERLTPRDERPLAARRRAAHAALARMRERRPEDHARRAAAVRELDDALRRLHVTADDVLAGDRARPRAHLRRALGRLLLAAPALLVGLVLWLGPALFGRAIGRRTASTPDKVVTVTILASFGAILVTHVIFFTTSLVYLPTPWSLLLVAATAVLSGLVPRAWDLVRAARRDLGRRHLAKSDATARRLVEGLTAIGRAVA